MTGKQIFGYRSNVRAARQRERSLSARESAALGGLVAGAPFALLGALLVVFGVFIAAVKFAFDLLSTLTLVVAYPRRAAAVIARIAGRQGMLGTRITAVVAVALMLAVGGTLVWEVPWFGAIWYAVGAISLVTWARGRPRPGWLLRIVAAVVLAASGPLAGVFLASIDRILAGRRGPTRDHA